MQYIKILQLFYWCLFFLLVLIHWSFYFLVCLFCFPIVRAFEKLFAEMFWGLRWRCLPLNRFGLAYVRPLWALMFWSPLTFHGLRFPESKMQCAPVLQIYARADSVATSSQWWVFSFLFSLLHLVQGSLPYRFLGGEEESCRFTSISFLPWRFRLLGSQLNVNRQSFNQLPCVSPGFWFLLPHLVSPSEAKAKN